MTAKRSFPLLTACTLSALVACSDSGQPTAPTADVGLAAAAAPNSAKRGLTRYVETFSSKVAGQSNFQLTLPCPNGALAVSGGFDLGADSQAVQILVSEPAAEADRWTFLVFNPHASSRAFEVHTVCLG